MIKHRFTHLIIVLIYAGIVSAQNPIDSSLKKINTLPMVSDSPGLQKEYETDLAFEGTKVTEKEGKFDKTGKVKLATYISTYYAYYSDSVGHEHYQKFPTSCPVSNTFALNMAMVSVKYTASRYRGVATLHWGDIPSSAWSLKYNFLQEANAGFKIANGLWFDAGFFRTHLGLESIQPRENITSSLATTTYYEPYFLSGAKLTYHVNQKLALQASIFNGFNSFIETNKNKTLGFSIVYDASDNLSIVFNVLSCDETADEQKRKQARVYNNLYLSYKSKFIDFGFELNYGTQKNSLLADSSKPANMLSALAVARLRANKCFNLYGRVEYFDDRNEILTGPIQNQYHQLVGLHIWGATGGLEIKIIPNSYIRFEYRFLEVLEKDETIFYYDGNFRNYRNEFISSIGLWF